MDKRLKRAETIAKACRSGKYDTEILPSGEYLSKCNLFLDDVLKSQWSIALPRHSEDSIWSKIYPGWKDRPMKAPALEIYLREAAKSPKSGVRRIKHKEAASLATQGEPVVALGLGHATLFAPNTDWPSVYRSDLAFREEDKRIKVGLKKSSCLKAFHINSEQYKKYRELNKVNMVAKP